MKIIKLLLILLVLQPASAQIQKFGKIKKQDFTIKNLDKYKNDDAIILFKKRLTKYEYDQTTGWAIVTKVHERIYLKNKEGFKYATNKINYYESNSDERVYVKAVTYNLQGSKIIKTKLDKHAVYDKKITKHWKQKVFTMPNLKKGSIVEWEYSVQSPYTRYIPDIIYKTLIPIKYLEAEVYIPEFYIFKYHPTPFFPVRLTEEDSNMSVDIVEKNRNIGKTGNISGPTSFQHHNYDFEVKVYKLKLQDVAAIPNEPYITDINNYIGKIQFELSFIKYPNQAPEYVSTTWKDICKNIYFDSRFGREIKKHVYYQKDLKNTIAHDSLPIQKLNSIYNFVKSKVTWNREYGIFSDFGGVSRAYKNGSGNVAEINFILISMLKKAGLDADPVLVSTISHGVPLYPSIESFNYIVTAVKFPEGYVLMDPTEKYAPIGVLPHRDLNWRGQLVKKDGQSMEIQLFPQFYSNAKKIVSATLDEDGGIKGFDVEKYTGNIALIKRKMLGKKQKDDLKKSYEEQFDNLVVNNIRMNNFSKLDRPYKAMLQFKMEDFVDEVGDKLIFSPVLFFKANENIFKADKRFLPIYFGFPFIENYEININLPEAYEIEKIPDNQAFSAGDYGTYIYNIAKTPEGLKLSIEQKISAPVVPNTDYQILKDFFQKIFEKENEKVVLKEK